MTHHLKMADRESKNRVKRQKNATNNKFKRKNNKFSPRNSEVVTDKRQLFVMREYRKMLKKEKKGLTNQAAEDVKNVDQSEATTSDDRKEKIKRINKELKMSSLKRAQQIYNRKQEEIKARKAEREEMKKEKEKALAQYHENKRRKFEILRKKTKKGQPLMKGRIELLLEKIEKMVKC